MATFKSRRLPSKYHRSLGTIWMVDDSGNVLVYMMTLGRDASSVAAACRNWDGWGYDAREATPDDCPPEVPEGLVIVHVPLIRWDEFVAGIVASDEEHCLFATVNDAWDFETSAKSYSDTLCGKALASL